MRRRLGILIPVLAVAAVLASMLFTPPAPVRASTVWNLTWSDEFDGANGTSPDSTKWNMETGGGGWGNNELENYTSRTENAHVQDGILIVEARQESFGGNAYTSARMTTQGKFEQAYGKFEVRMKLPG